MADHIETLRVSDDTIHRLNVAWESVLDATRDLDSETFWGAKAEAEERLAGMYHEIVRSTKDLSVLRKMALDAQSYRRANAKRARELRGEV